MIKKLYIILIFLIILFSCKKNEVSSILYTNNISIYNNQTNDNPLLIPPLLENKSKNSNEVHYELTVQKGEYEFVKGTKVITYGYNGNYLGPTIRAKKNQKVKIKIANKLREYTTVHWHGLLVPGEVDGGPHQIINPDGEWNPEFIIIQPAATAWYHPHGIGNTAIQVYKGLAGLFIIDDEVSENLNLPKDYGVDDIPLVIQDKRLTSDGVPLYLTNMNDIMEGMKGNTILVNGVVNPYLDVATMKYRFRLLNGSNARTYNFRLSNREEFYQIAADAGFLEKPVNLQELRLSPGERAEIIIDFSKNKKGNIIYLESGNFEIIKFRVNKIVKDNLIIPEKLTEIEWLKMRDSNQFRNFRLEGMGPHVSINGKIYDMNRIDEVMNLNNTEIWTLTSTNGGMMGMMRSSSGMLHNFHAHGIHFQILERNGKEVPENEKGWKDTVLIEENEKVKIITRFLYKGLFMYHCHVLEHEDNGMMGQFVVE